MAVSRIGHVYPQSRCAKAESSHGSATAHLENVARPPVFVTVGAVGVSADGRRAHVQVVTWPGELEGESHLLRYRKVATEWQLEDRRLMMQE